MKNLNFKMTFIVNLLRTASAAVFIAVFYKLLIHYDLIAVDPSANPGFFAFYGMIFIVLAVLSLASVFIGGTALIPYILCAPGYIITDLILYFAFRNVHESKYSYKLFNAQFLIYFQL